MGKTVPRNREYYNNLLGLSSSSVFKNETPPKPPAVCIKCVNIDLRIALAMHWKTFKQQVGVNIYEDLTKAKRDQRKLRSGIIKEIRQRQTLGEKITYSINPVNGVLSVNSRPYDYLKQSLQHFLGKQHRNFSFHMNKQQQRTENK